MFGRMMVSALALSGAAYAQTPEAHEQAQPDGCQPQPCSTAPATADRVVFEAAAFAQYNPQTALDMVRQTPGFTLDGGDDERRGFSGAVGNVLIDGVRPSTKSQSLDGILSRIPANQVVRIEVLRGAAVAGDASGQATLVNIVRTPTAGSGVFSAGFERTSRDVFAPQGELSYSGRSGTLEYGLSASIYSLFRDVPGERLLYTGPAYAGRVVTPSRRDYREASITGNVAFPMLGGRLAANGQVGWNRFHADNDFFFFDVADDPTRSLLQVFEERELGYEFGLNFDRDFGAWSLALIGLANHGAYESEEDGAFLDGLGAPDAAYVQDVEHDTTENIARATLAGPLAPAHRIEFGGEVAFNSLEQRLNFESTPIPAGPIPNANVLVEEERAEVFASHNWRPAQNWSLETRAAWETSTLTFTGDTNQTVDLSFWKPSIQLSHAFGGNDQVRLRLYRDVGQLDFGDFVSAAAVADSLLAGGNPDLVPQTAWIAELGADLRFEGGAALNLTLQHRAISDVADVVKIVDDNGTPGDVSDDFTYDAPGNIGDAELNQLSLNFSTPVSFLPGGRLVIEGFIRNSEVTDPITGRPREISFTPDTELEVSFRQDLTSLRLAWGIGLEKQGEFQAYRFNEIEINEEGPWVDAFIETTALPHNMKLRLAAANVFSGSIRRDRHFFGGDLTPDRNDPLVARELRRREFHQAPWFILSLSGAF
jgi:hypothetical protein